MLDQVSEFIESYSDRAKRIRREFHQIPETGWEEYLTTWNIYQYLLKLDIDFNFVIGRELLESTSRLGLPSEDVLKEAHQRLVNAGADQGFIDRVSDGHTGLMAIFDTGKKGSNSVYRFDIDGLPMSEALESKHFPAAEGFSSGFDGKMHACGHDCHISIGLGVAEFLSQNKSRMTGKIHLLFQPAEEGCRGARAVADKGWMNNVDYFLSGHVGIEALPVGTVVIKTGEMLATRKLDVQFSGRSSHAANNPQDGSNALLAGASSALGLHGISRHSGGGSRVNVGTLNAGAGRNIIADKATMMVELRGENDDINNYMFEQAKNVIAGAAMMHGVDYQLEMVGEAMAGHCDSDFSEQIKSAIEGSPEVKNIIPLANLRASEDASILMNAVQQGGGKATYMMFCSPTKGGHHHREFDIDEAAMDVAIDVFARAMLSLNG